MLAIKLTRIGKKKQPQYRVIVTEKSRDPWGKALEIIGRYNPLSEPKFFEVKKDRLEHFLGNGAQPTDTVHNLLIRFGYTKGEKITKIHISKKRADKKAGKKK